MAYLAAENVTLGYDAHAVAENISFSVEKGDYLCIVGENGSGKTTLMRTILHLMEPLSGKIEISDEIGHGGIGYLPQQTSIQRDFPASVKEVVLSGCQANREKKFFYTREDRARAERSMERMGISDLALRCYRELSGGQQQRVLLARALCATEKLLLLDEPVAGLDPKVTAEMYELIRGLNEDGVTIIMISHDIDAAVRFASHILHIGASVFFGTRDEYLASDVSRRFLV